jgi:hypothetical protein
MNANKNQERQTADETQIRQEQTQEGDWDAYQREISLRQPSA